MAASGPPVCAFLAWNILQTLKALQVPVPTSIGILQREKMLDISLINLFFG